MARKVSSPSDLQVLFEDNHLIAINKRPGDIVQGDKTGDEPLSEIVKRYIKKKYEKPGRVFLGVIHRLDRPTSGVVIFARTSKALSRMNKLLAEKKIQKQYWAIVPGGNPKEEETLIHWLKKNPKNNKSTAFSSDTKASKRAVLHYKRKLQLDNYDLLEVELETGRHHQIRCQLSKIGFPIKGDLKYGASRSNSDGSIHLHARQIKFVHPVSKENISIVAPTLSDPIWDAVNQALG